MVGRVESIRNFLLHGSKNNVENEQPTSHASQQGPPPLTQGNLLKGIDNKMSHSTFSRVIYRNGRNRLRGSTRPKVPPNENNFS